MAVLAHPYRLDMLDSLAPAEPFQNRRQPIPVAGGEQQGDVPPHHLFCGVTIEVFRPTVPTHDRTVQRFADNGEIGGFHDSGELRSLLLGSFAFGDLQTDSCEADRAPSIVNKHLAFGKYPVYAAVRPNQAEFRIPRVSALEAFAVLCVDSIAVVRMDQFQPLRVA